MAGVSSWRWTRAREERPTVPARGGRSYDDSRHLRLPLRLPRAADLGQQELEPPGPMWDLRHDGPERPLWKTRRCEELMAYLKAVYRQKCGDCDKFATEILCNHSNEEVGYYCATHGADHLTRYQAWERENSEAGLRRLLADVQPSRQHPREN